MKKIILILAVFIFSVVAFGQNTIKREIDQFGNEVYIENLVETTHFSIFGKDAMFVVNNGKVGMFGTKYALSLPGESAISGRYMDWNVSQNRMNLDEKNLIKLYASLKNKVDNKISGAKVFASNKVHNEATRVNVKVTVNNYVDGETTATRIFISQRSYMDSAPVLDEDWILDENDVENLINVISKYINIE